VAYVLTVERSFTLEVRIAVFTAMSNSWRFIRRNAYFRPAFGAFTNQIAKAVSTNARVVPTPNKGGGGMRVQACSSGQFSRDMHPQTAVANGLTKAVPKG
jgi:hypothetical protein